MSTTATSRELQQQLIRTCLNFDTWSYNRMAGRLYATLIRKDLYRNRRPTVLDLHRQLQQLGFMEMLQLFRIGIRGNSGVDRPRARFPNTPTTSCTPT